MDSDVGGVIVDAHFVHRELCKFLEGKSNHLLITDLNHNARILLYQLIGCSCLPVSGIHDIDPQMLQVYEISKDLWRPKDFASYLLVLKLDSSGTVKNFTDTIMIGEYPASVGSLCT